jgi:hypothetical protein
VPGRLRQEEVELEANMSYIAKTPKKGWGAYQ